MPRLFRHRESRWAAQVLEMARDAGLQFVKVFYAHEKPLTSLSASVDGKWLCSTSIDQTMKFYDVVNFDMVSMMKVDYIPATCAWVSRSNDPLPRVAVSDRASGTIRFYNAETSSAVHELKVHPSPVLAIAYNESLDVAVSVDEKGFIEYWRGSGETRAVDVDFAYKMDTDLFLLAKPR